MLACLSKSEEATEAVQQEAVLTPVNGSLEQLKDGIY